MIVPAHHPHKVCEIRHDLKYECMSYVDFPVEFSGSNEAVRVDHDPDFSFKTQLEKEIFTHSCGNIRVKSVCVMCAGSVCLYVVVSVFSAPVCRTLRDFHLV